MTNSQSDFTGVYSEEVLAHVGDVVTGAADYAQMKIRNPDGDRVTTVLVISEETCPDPIPWIMKTLWLIINSFNTAAESTEEDREAG